MDCKYIVIGKDGRELMFVFPASVVHADFADATLGMRLIGSPMNHRHPYWDYKVISAGFIDYRGMCIGKSESLDIKSRPEIDTALLNRGMAS